MRSSLDCIKYLTGFGQYDVEDKTTHVTLYRKTIGITTVNFQVSLHTLRLYDEEDAEAEEEDSARPCATID
jgi:hypothetical protein